ncbi:MAG: metabolite traffic protein EboE [Leptolyngbyaceae cyanobacterium CSU_1_3]|nr:metabolite traffic protein EboE [Leptolyngbyaceae cyanobacterium CSU_1_3]
MKIGTNGELHLTYCTNIHPGESWTEISANLKQYLPELKQRLSPSAPFGVGLRLSDRASRELLEGDRLSELQAWLHEQNLYVFTLNGFPYGGFHQQVVKDHVYAPDWSQRDRLDYTLRLTHILTALLLDGVDGGISTLPLSYKPWWAGQPEQQKTVMQASTHHVATIAAAMVQIRQTTGKLLHLDLEPEPDGLLENTAEVVAFFRDWLLPVGGVWLANHLEISQSLAERHLRDHIRICYDTCHFAVEYEQPHTVLEQFHQAGIQIGKVQLSAALKMQIPHDADKRQFLGDRLQPFAESTYLHQVIKRHTDGTLHHSPDLILALAELEQTAAQEWRTHFHVPIFIETYQVFQSTQADITALLKLLQTHPACHHLEIETYTWDVLPPEMKFDILTSIQREYEWVLSVMGEGSDRPPSST